MECSSSIFVLLVCVWLLCGTGAAVMSLWIDRSRHSTLGGGPDLWFIVLLIACGPLSAAMITLLIAIGVFDIPDDPRH